MSRSKAILREAQKLIQLEQEYRELQKLREQVKKRENWLRKFLDQVATEEEY